MVIKTETTLTTGIGVKIIMMERIAIIIMMIIKILLSCLTDQIRSSSNDNTIDIIKINETRRL